MDINRNQFFMAGVIVLLLGLQFRTVDSFVLNEKFTKFIVERTKSRAEGSATAAFVSAGAAPRQVIKPPQWLGWSLLSVGSVLVLHSLAMKRPGG